MSDDDFPDQPFREESPLTLRCWATEDQLKLGLEAARTVFWTRGIVAGRAAVCSLAVSAYKADPSLPEPAAEVRASAAAFDEANDAAILAAGGMLNQDNALECEQRPEDRVLWDSLPTLRAWRAKHPR